MTGCRPGPDLGDRVLVTGDNGAGKTTLLRAVAGKVPATAGSAAVLAPVGLGRS